jgi:bifunctional DNA-binding transcriptional regulator/antitoxin component of YhaV-PrlF toxin-antitoxin module
MYNDLASSYNDGVSSYVMKVSRNGQVSIPAAARRRWDTDLMIVVDLGDRVVISPAPEGGRAALRGKYAGVGPTTDEMRARAKAEDAEREDRAAG